jgi:hypothetical protein
LDLRIWLEKNTYDAGETAKGTLIIKANSSLKVQKFTFSVCGKERYLEETKKNHIEPPIMNMMQLYEST